MKHTKPVVSLTRKDFVLQTFRAGGKGGQNQNKTDSGVRIIHPASGARGESREERSQHLNRKIAFNRLVKHPRFQAWLAQQHRAVLDGKTPEQKVAEQMRPHHLKIEARDEKGQWTEIK